MTPGNQTQQATAPKLVQGLKGKGKALIDSTSEVRVTWTKTLLLIGALVVAWNVINHVWYRKTGDPWFGIQPVAQAQEATVEPTPTPTDVETFHVVASMSTPEPEIIEVVVTATPTVVPPTPIVEYIYAPPVEVTKYITVEVPAIPLPTPTAIPLAAGTVEICVRVEGAREIYIGGAGVVSGGCETFAFGVGQTSIPVQVNK